jgi:transposase
VGRDGATVLAALYSRNAPPWVREVPAVQCLRRIWGQQYYTTTAGLRWRTEVDGLPPARLFINSPYDDEAHLGRKGTTQWVGYKVHLTESCEPALPRLIPHVETTDAPVGDSDVVVPIHDVLKAKALLPRTHLVDTGDVEAKLLVQLPHAYGVDLLGPTRSDYHWQSQAGQGFAAGDFQIDWRRQEATCPQGKRSLSWTPAIDRSDNDVIKIKFSRRDCRPCPSRSLCTTSHHLRRTITIRAHADYEALYRARRRQETASFQKAYAQRAGIEGTISQGVRRCRLRRTRYIGQAKTHLQHIFTATALNFVRVGEWLAGTPLAKTRRSAFVKCMKP